VPSTLAGGGRSLRYASSASPGPAASAGRRLHVAESGAEPGLGRPLAQLNGEFLLTGRNGRWLLIDLGATRRLFTQTRLRQQWASGGIRRQPLLVPLELDVEEKDAKAVEEYAASLMSCGLRLEPVAPLRFAVRELPQLLPDADAVLLAREVIVVLHDDRADADRVEAILGVLVRHCHPPDAASQSPESLAAELRSLETLNLDLAADEHPGLWRTLDRQALQRLLRAGR